MILSVLRLDSVRRERATERHAPTCDAALKSRFYGCNASTASLNTPSAKHRATIGTTDRFAISAMTTPSTTLNARNRQRHRQPFIGFRDMAVIPTAGRLAGLLA